MTATLTHQCDYCGDVIVRDVTAAAASGCRIYAGYPDTWLTGDTHDACPKTECQARCKAEDAPPADEYTPEEATGDQEAARWD